jgi:hypothetical protein
LDNPSVPATVDKPSKWDSNLIIHYTHEKRFRRYQKEIHQLWKQTFKTTPAALTKLIIGHRNNKNMKREHVRRRPHANPSKTRK